VEERQMITWEEFKKAVEAKGVKDTDVVDYIDWSGYHAIDELVRVERETYENGETAAKIT